MGCKSRKNGGRRKEPQRRAASPSGAPMAERLSTWVLQISGTSVTDRRKSDGAYPGSFRDGCRGERRRAALAGGPLSRSESPGRTPDGLLLLGRSPVAEAELGVGPEDQRLRLGVDGDLR